jgi:hypothetical protein
MFDMVPSVNMKQTKIDISFPLVFWTLKTLDQEYLRPLGDQAWEEKKGLSAHVN